MIKEIPIEDSQKFKDCGGKIIGEVIGGSILYGLNTPTSDVDRRGIFVARHPHYTSGLKKIENIVQLDKVEGRDSAYYELTHFLLLMAKTNTQVMEIMFAPDSAFEQSHIIMKLIRENKLSLIDSERLKNSLIGYIISELRLATGERTGQLGGNRKEAIEKYGFSPKNFVQIFRLARVGKEFFENEIYPVNLKTFDPDFCSELLDIKVNPQNYKKEDLEARVQKELDELRKVMDDSSIKLEFDWDFAAELISYSRDTKLDYA